MAQLKSIRIILVVAGVVLVVSLFMPFFNQPTTTGAALIVTPPARDNEDPPKPPSTPNGGGPNGGSSGSNKSEKKDEIFASIYGQVTDLSTGRPGQGLEIDIEGIIVRTDSEGRFSLTGLDAGTYEATLILPNQATAAQGSITISLGEEETVTIDLDYYSQNPPTPTPVDTPEPELEPTPTPAPAEDILPEVQFDDTAAAFSPFTPPTGKVPAVFINPSHINNEEGVVGNITIDVSNVSDLGAFQAMLKFNPKVIKIEDVILGNFLESTGRQTNPLVTEVDNTAGELSFVAYTSGSTAGPNGGGTLAVVNFISKQEGISNLDMEDVILVARLGKTINATVGDGRISVTVCFGDLNGDKIIDVSDVQAVAGRVGQTVGDPNYVLTYDLNNDNLINEVDVEMITERLYETCS